VKTIECTQGHYEAQDVEFGRVYRWCPESVVVECNCGERPALTWSMSTCDGCGADHAAAVREELAARWLADEAAHPWRYARERENASLPF
jgi:hypothetical protein